MIQNIKEKTAVLNISKEKAIAVAVSGGMDSMALLYILQKLFQKIVVFHCNFQLRETATKDERFVKEYCKVHSLTCKTRRFETKTLKKTSPLSSQELARNLRYDWFQEEMKHSNIQYLFIAHHQDDSVETFFLNLLRKTGTRGLKGIPLQNNNVIRPLYDISKKKIEQFVAKEGIPYRTDETNMSLIYKRNYLRNKILPLLESEFPGIKKNVSDTIEIIRESNKIIEDRRKMFREKILLPFFSSKKLSLLKLTEEEHFFLKEWLSENGISYDITKKIISIDSHETKKFFGKGKTFFLKSKTLSFSEKTDKKTIEKQINTIDKKGEISLGFLNIQWKKLSYPPIFKEKTATFEVNSLQFPLTVRKWKNGDTFTPFGMKGRKKVSDYLTGLKIPLQEKEKTFVLSDKKGTILWVVPFMINEKMKVNDLSKELITFSIQE